MQPRQRRSQTDSHRTKAFTFQLKKRISAWAQKKRSFANTSEEQDEDDAGAVRQARNKTAANKRVRAETTKRENQQASVSSVATWDSAGKPSLAILCIRSVGL